MPRHPWGAVSGARNQSASAILAVVDSDGIDDYDGARPRRPERVAPPC